MPETVASGWHLQVLCGVNLYAFAAHGQDCAFPQQIEISACSSSYAFFVSSLQMPAPLFANVPVMVLSRGLSENPSRFSSLRFLSTLFPDNLKYLIVPEPEVQEYKRFAKGKGMTVLVQPGRGLADAEIFACEHPALGNRIDTPYVIKLVDDIKEVRIKRLDGSSSNVTPREFAEACQTMLDGLCKYGGHLAGFEHGSLQNCRVETFFETGQLD